MHDNDMRTWSVHMAQQWKTAVKARKIKVFTSLVKKIKVLRNRIRNTDETEILGRQN